MPKSTAPKGMTLWTSDIVADTHHLTTTQFGAWARIQIAMWRNGGTLPNDESRLANIVGLPRDKWRKIAGLVLELYKTKGDKITDPMLCKNLKSTLGRIEKRRQAGRAGGIAKSMKNKNPDLANANDLPEQPHGFCQGNDSNPDYDTDPHYNTADSEPLEYSADVPGEYLRTHDSLHSRERSKTLDAAKGHWREILPALGIPAAALNGKHQACPACGGKDRFRFDDRDGDGDYFCSGCKPGKGLSLVMKVNGWDYAKAAQAVDELIGNNHPGMNGSNVFRLRNVGDAG